VRASPQLPVLSHRRILRASLRAFLAAVGSPIACKLQHADGGIVCTVMGWPLAGTATRVVLGLEFTINVFGQRMHALILRRLQRRRRRLGVL
jgi:hypothetical protein